MEEKKLCPNCGKNEESEPHNCPYESDINDDNEFRQVLLLCSDDVD